MTINNTKIVYIDPRAEGQQLKSGSLHAAGYDLSIFPRDQDGNPVDHVTILAGETKMVSTGIKVWIGGSGNCNLFGMIVPRSSIGHRLNIMLGNTTGIIDADYQGELLLSLHNRSDDRDVKLAAGDRVAQMIFVPFIRSTVSVVEDFSHTTARGEGGYGSTGK